MLIDAKISPTKLKDPGELTLASKNPNEKPREIASIKKNPSKYLE